MRNLLKLSKICQNFHNVNVVSVRNAGHSKWQNIKHIKGAKDAERAALFTKLGRMMKVAVAEGGTVDPKKNLKLSQVIEQAKRANMPVATIQSILKSTETDKSGAKPHLVEIKGPGSCIILCEVFTNNIQMFKQTVATILKKHSSKFNDGGGIHLFEEKGLIDVVLPTDFKDKTEETVLEAATDHAIESGAEDVRVLEENESLQFICGASNLNSVVADLEKLQYKVSNAAVEFIPLKMQALQDEELKVAEKLYEKLQALPEVTKLSDNIA